MVAQELVEDFILTLIAGCAGVRGVQIDGISSGVPRDRQGVPASRNAAATEHAEIHLFRQGPNAFRPKELAGLEVMAETARAHTVEITPSSGPSVGSA
jgi:hypothetical protein